MLSTNIWLPEIEVIAGYKCSCGNAFFDRKLAEICCVPKHCTDCGCIMPKSSFRSLCRSCIEKSNQLHWECAEKASATRWLHSEVLGEYFEVSALLDERYYILDLYSLPDDEAVKVLSLSWEEIARRYQIYLCKRSIPSPLDLNEYYAENNDEDYDLPDGWVEAEKAVNDWINSVDEGDWLVMPSQVGWNGQELA
jgi:hypothetical protein